MAKRGLILTETDPGPARVVGLSGRFEPDSAAQLRDRLDRLLSRTGAKTRLVLDLGGVDYLPVEGLKTLLHLIRAVNRLDGRLVLCGLGEYAAEVLEGAGVSLLVPVSPDRESALQEF